MHEVDIRSSRHAWGSSRTSSKPKPLSNDSECRSSVVGKVVGISGVSVPYAPSSTLGLPNQS